MAQLFAIRLVAIALFTITVVGRGVSYGQEQPADESLTITFDPVEARYVRLIGYSEANSEDDWAGATEIELLGGSAGTPLARQGWTILDSSNHTDEASQPASGAIDGDAATAWISHGPAPHHVDIQLSQALEITGLRYVPPVGKGAIHVAAVFVSNDGVNWGEAVKRDVLVPLTDATPTDTLRSGAPSPPELELRPFAPPYLVHGPMALALDDRNRVYLAETYRFDGRGVIDSRGKPRREEEDLQTSTLSDRRMFLEKWLAEGELAYELTKHQELFPSPGEFFTKFSEKAVMLEDENGDGLADRRQVVAEEFDDLLSGTAAGVLVNGQDIYFACVPDLWMLTDANGDDRADERRALSSGYGVRTGWFGHDLHGLTWGLDGRIYFTMADRGFHVEAPEGRVFYGPGTGGVFRCWPDGSDLELVAQGLRNPQELAFDDLGYLFTVDNNSNAGDQTARLVYVVEGGDSGWNMSMQSLTELGPWVKEAMGEERREKDDPLQPSWIVPPIALFNTEPMGMAANPGTGLPPRYDGYFLVCDYRGGLGAIQAFRTEPEGASFRMLGLHAFYEGPTAVDLAFGKDGKLYVAEWGPGWDISPHARVFTLSNDSIRTSAAVSEIRSLFHAGFERLTDDELGALLEHKDRRVRVRAQSLLANRDAHIVLERVLTNSRDRLARLHCLWGLGQMARKEAAVLEITARVYSDADPEVRGRALRIAAEHGYEAAGEAALVALGAVNHPRLRFHAAYAVGKLAPEGSLDALLDLIQSNDNEDEYLRHAAIMGLIMLNEREALLAKAQRSASVAVRLATVLALRRWSAPELSDFLSDASPLVATEAARAIYDRELASVLPLLAQSLQVTETESVPTTSAPFLCRALEANFQIGGEAEAERLCLLAQQESVPQALRKLALERLLAWDSPPNREGIWGRWRPLRRLQAGLAKAAVRRSLPNLLQLTDKDLLALAQRLDGVYGEDKSPGQLAAIVESPELAETVRIDALLGLEKTLPEEMATFERICQLALVDPVSSALRSTAIQAWTRVKDIQAIPALRTFLETSLSADEKQAAVQAANALPGDERRGLFTEWMANLQAGTLDRDIALDVFEIAENADDPELNALAKAYREKIGGQGIQKLALHGGNVARGRTSYESNLAAQCMRCHALEGRGGDVGPALDGLAARRNPAFILESVVAPQAAVTMGYGVQSITTKSGDLVMGVLVSEDDQSITIREGNRSRKLAKADVADRSEPVSGMPPAGLVLKPRELRDLLAFLQSLK